LRALALINPGITELWAARLEEAERHLEQGVALARRIARSYLEFSGLAHQALEIYRSLARPAERSRQAVELAERHGWTDEPAAGVAYMTLANVLAWQGWLEDAEGWMQRAERTVRADADPAAALSVYYVRGRLKLTRGRDAAALAAFRAAERLAGLLAAPHLLVMRVRALLLHALVRMGELERAERTFASLGGQARERDAGRSGLPPAGAYGAIGSRCWLAPAAVTSPGHNRRLGLPR